MLAPALVLAAFGAAAALPMALIFSFDNALIVITAPLMMTLGSTMRVDPAELAQRIVRQALLNPLVLATILGLLFALTGLTLPVAAEFGAVDAGQRRRTGGPLHRRRQPDRPHHRQGPWPELPVLIWRSSSSSTR